MHIKEMREAIKILGLDLVEVTVTDRSEIARAVLSLVGKVNATVISSDNTTIQETETIAKLCIDEKKIALSLVMWLASPWEPLPRMSWIILWTAISFFPRTTAL